MVVSAAAADSLESRSRRLPVVVESGAEPTETLSPSARRLSIGKLSRLAHPTAPSTVIGSAGVDAVKSIAIRAPAADRESCRRMVPPELRSVPPNPKPWPSMRCEASAGAMVDELAVAGAVVDEVDEAAATAAAACERSALSSRWQFGGAERSEGSAGRSSEEGCSAESFGPSERVGYSGSLQLSPRSLASCSFGSSKFADLSALPPGLKSASCLSKRADAALGVKATSGAFSCHARRFGGGRATAGAAQRAVAPPGATRDASPSPPLDALLSPPPAPFRSPPSMPILALGSIEEAEDFESLKSFTNLCIGADTPERTRRTLLLMLPPPPAPESPDSWDACRLIPLPNELPPPPPPRPDLGHSSRPLPYIRPLPPPPRARCEGSSPPHSAPCFMCMCMPISPLG
mmetsp:Transcript_48819/g.97421  ORF Transcript_48819/g.97421 Transcript_48819/m.97421 type:complete len:404 (-) Transcript_48819:185-1396(-)